MVRGGGTLERSIDRLFEKARGWNRVAKAAEGESRQRAYGLKKRALERIRELRPDALRIESVEANGADSVLIGVAVCRRGRLHLVLRLEDHRPGGPWNELPWN